MYRILASDGGGIRSIFTAVIYRRIEEKFPGFINRADLYAGTSAGAIVAGALAVGYSPKDIEQLFIDKSKVIFKRTLKEELLSGLGLARAKYDNDGIREVLRDKFGDRKLSDLKKTILVPAFELCHDFGNGEKYWRPKVYHNYFRSPLASPDELLRDVVTRSAAAPTYFPSFQGFVDGGVYANNPAMAALSESMREYSGKQECKNIAMLSVGTGFQKISIETKNNDWGFAQWIEHTRLIDLLMDGSVGSIHYYAESILGARYHRFNPAIGEIKLDDVGAVRTMIDIAERANIDDILHWCEGFWMC